MHGMDDCGHMYITSEDEHKLCSVMVLEPAIAISLIADLQKAIPLPEHGQNVPVQGFESTECKSPHHTCLLRQVTYHHIIPSSRKPRSQARSLLPGRNRDSVQRRPDLEHWRPHGDRSRSSQVHSIPC